MKFICIAFFILLALNKIDAQSGFEPEHSYRNLNLVDYTKVVKKPTIDSAAIHKPKVDSLAILSSEMKAKSQINPESLPPRVIIIKHEIDTTDPVYTHKNLNNVNYSHPNMAADTATKYVYEYVVVDPKAEERKKIATARLQVFGEIALTLIGGELVFAPFVLLGGHTGSTSNEAHESYYSPYNYKLSQPLDAHWHTGYGSSFTNPTSNYNR